MRKIIISLLVSLMIFTLYGCIHSKVTNASLDIYYLNDTHGAVLAKNDELGLASIANLINDKKEKFNDETLFITGGDMFQGELISNSNKGALMIEALNIMKLDAFVLGNHEFDWGIDVILDYFDDETDGVKADFPLLAANVINKNTGERPVNMKPYTIVEKKGIKVGIIGTIGDGLESSIASLRVKDYEFTSSVEAVKKYSLELEDKVDTIIVATHNEDYRFNETVSKIDKVSAIFNAHTHKRQISQVNNIPVLQSGSSGKFVGNMKLDFEVTKKNHILKTNSADNLNRNNNDLLKGSNKEVANLIDSYYSEIEHLYKEPLIIARENMSQDQLGLYIAKVMKEVTGSVLGLQNKGGTRASLRKDQVITAADLFKIFPFDNQIIYTKVKGSYLKVLNEDRYFLSSRDIDNNEIDNDQYYSVGTNDYIFYHNNNKFIKNQESKETIYGDMYETFLEVITLLKENGHEYFDRNSPILIPSMNKGLYLVDNFTNEGVNIYA